MTGYGKLIWEFDEEPKLSIRERFKAPINPATSKKDLT
jgi:hypothetical protein